MFLSSYLTDFIDRLFLAFETSLFKSIVCMKNTVKKICQHMYLLSVLKFIPIHAHTNALSNTFQNISHGNGHVIIFNFLGARIGNSVNFQVSFSSCPECWHCTLDLVRPVRGVQPGPGSHSAVPPSWMSPLLSHSLEAGRQSHGHRINGTRYKSDAATTQNGDADRLRTLRRCGECL